MSDLDLVTYETLNCDRHMPDQDAAFCKKKNGPSNDGNKNTWKYQILGYILDVLKYTTALEQH